MDEDALAAADPAVGLAAVAALHRLADRMEAVHVDNARRLGWSWAEIASVLGVSKQAVHQKRREGLLSADELCEMWMTGRERLFGPEVHLPDWNRWGWLRHAQAINQPFYTYLYPFGLLLVYALFQQYKQEGSAFADRYLAMLRSGVSMPVSELLAQVGVDIEDPAFWHRGLDLLEGMIAEFEDLGA